MLQISEFFKNCETLGQYDILDVTRLALSKYEKVRTVWIPASDQVVRTFEKLFSRR